jgi:DNA-directed RNA polymerase subunit omega
MMDALSLLPEYDPSYMDSRYRLVIAASQRAKHLMQGARPVDPSPRYFKATSIALDEILSQKVRFLTGKEARQALKEAKRATDREFEMMTPMAQEDVHEIAKELSVYVDDSAKPAEPEGED